MELIAEVKSVSKSDGILNYIVHNSKGEIFNLKVHPNDDKGILVGKVYLFTCSVKNAERISYWVTDAKSVTELELEEQNKYLRAFYKSSEYTLAKEQKEIEKYLGKLENKIIKDITVNLINKYHDKFFTYPAAAKMHHAYVGGLAYHSIGMLHIADGLIENYPYLNKDYVYAGIMLHDIGKAIELSGPANAEYTLEGQLIGHLVIGAIEIEKMAMELGYQHEKEVLLLKHMLISHHGLPQFGSAKKPMTPEALLLWYIDTIDSKFRVLGEELEKIESGEYTDPIGVIDKAKIYKP